MERRILGHLAVMARPCLSPACCVAWVGIRVQVESSGAALGAHKQCQGPAGAGQEWHKAGMCKDPAQQGQASLS